MEEKVVVDRLPEFVARPLRSRERLKRVSDQIELLEDVLVEHAKSAESLARMQASLDRFYSVVRREL